MKNSRPQSDSPPSEAVKAYKRKSASLDEALAFFKHRGAAQIRAARAGLNWTQRELAMAAGVSLTTIRRMEAADFKAFRGNLRCMMQVIAALEDNGAMFTDPDPNADVWGGVQFRYAKGDTIMNYRERTRDRGFSMTTSTIESDQKILQRFVEK